MRQEVPFYVELAEHIKEVRTFDLDQNDGQYPTIHWMIARSMLDDLSEFNRTLILPAQAGQVKRSFVHALNFLKEQGIIVYRSRDNGKRNIKFMSLDSDYKACQKLDFNRQTDNIQSKVESFAENVKLMHPEQAPLITSEAARFNNKLLSMK